MAGSYVEAIGRAAEDAQSLVRYLDGLDERGPATPAAIGHAAQLVDAVERTVWPSRKAAIRLVGQTAADQGWRHIDAFRAAAQGVMWADARRARAALDHLNRARELDEPAP